MESGRLNNCEGITNMLTSFTASKDYSLLLLSFKLSQFTFRMIVRIIHLRVPEEIKCRSIIIPQTFIEVESIRIEARWGMSSILTLGKRQYSDIFIFKGMDLVFREITIILFYRMYHFLQKFMHFTMPDKIGLVFNSSDKIS